MQALTGPVLTGTGKRCKFCKAKGGFRPICRWSLRPDAARPAQSGAPRPLRLLGRHRRPPALVASQVHNRKRFASADHVRARDAAARANHRSRGSSFSHRKSPHGVRRPAAGKGFQIRLTNPVVSQPRRRRATSSAKSAGRGASNRRERPSAGWRTPRRCACSACRGKSMKRRPSGPYT